MTGTTVLLWFVAITTFDVVAVLEIAHIAGWL